MTLLLTIYCDLLLVFCWPGNCPIIIVLQYDCVCILCIGPVPVCVPLLLLLFPNDLIVLWYVLLCVLLWCDLLLLYDINLMCMLLYLLLCQWYYGIIVWCDQPSRQTDQNDDIIIVCWMTDPIIDDPAQPCINLVTLCDLDDPWRVLLLWHWSLIVTENGIVPDAGGYYPVTLLAWQWQYCEDCCWWPVMTLPMMTLWP